MSLPDTAFLSIITWPQSGGSEAAVKQMAVVSGLDELHLRLQARKQVPGVLGRFPIAAARAAAQAVIELGGDAFAPTMADIEALGLTRKVRDIRLASDGIEFDLWRGAPETVALQDVDLIVLAHLSQTVRPAVPRANTTMLPMTGAAALTYGWGFGGSFGLAAAIYADQQVSDWAEIDTRMVVSHKLDLHVKTNDGDPLIYQIDGDKFGFQILGDRRGASDKVNIERLCELFTMLNPSIIVDPYFRLWKAPPGHDRMRVPMMQLNQDDPAFAFYSRWSALMYRHVAGTVEVNRRA